MSRPEVHLGLHGFARLIIDLEVAQAANINPVVQPLFHFITHEVEQRIPVSLRAQLFGDQVVQEISPLPIYTRGIEAVVDALDPDARVEVLADINIEDDPIDVRAHRGNDCAYFTEWRSPPDAREMREDIVRLAHNAQPNDRRLADDQTHLKYTGASRKALEKSVQALLKAGRRWFAP